MTKLIALFILIFTLIEPAISDQFDKETVMAETIGKWNITEYFGNKWEGQAVHINLDDKTSAMIKGEEDNLCVMDNKGRRSPAQVIKKEKTQLWYRAELNQYEQKTYSLQYGKAESESPLELYFDGNVAEVANHKFGVRFSWCSETSEIYDKPKPLSDLSGPIQEIRGIDGLWFGNGYWRSDRLCSEFKCEVIEHGQVLIILRQTYVLSSGGEVVLEYRIDAATPAVQVRQISTSPEFGDSFVWEFYDNYDPAHAFWRPHSTETWKGSKSKWNRQIYKLLWKDSPDSISLTAFYNWGLNGAMFWSCWSENSNRNDMLVMGAIRPSMTKLTRGYKPFIVSAWNENGNKHLSLSCRIQEGQKAFFIGVINRNSALPEGDNPESRIEGFYRQMQCLGLDEYHQMCFEWEGMADTKFPHLMTKPDNLDELRNNFNGWTWLKERFDAHVNDRLFNTHDQHDMRIRDDARTFGSDWSGAYLATGDEEYAPCVST